MKKLLHWLNSPHKLEEIIINRDRNNFDIARHLAALIVIYQHSNFYLYSSGYWKAFGVPVFFFLSGLLVSQSFETSSSVKNFIWKRLLRIYPAAIVVILICALVIGPLITTYSLADYFRSPVFWKYISSVSLVRIYFNLPGVFQNSPLESVINPSLWTLPLEIKMYFFTTVWGLIKFRKKNVWLMLILLSLILIETNFQRQSQAFANTQLHLTTFNISVYTSVASLYLVGMLCYSYRSKIIVRPYWFFLGVLSFFIFSRLAIWGYLFHICVAMITLGFSVLSFTWLRKITHKNDYSYGLYIYGFPVQQLFVNYLYPRVDGFTLFLLIVLTTFIFAFLSWNLVEKRALKLKHYIN